MKNIYVFGNEYLENDCMAKKVIRCFRKDINILNLDNPDALLDIEEDNITIMDVVKGIKKPVIIKDISKLKTRKMISLHDFDLSFILNLMKTLKIKKKIKIIGIPSIGNISKIAEGIKKWI